MKDYINKTDPTDQSADSTGCGMAFLSWLMSQGYTLGKIAPTMAAAGDSGTFAQLYASLSANPATDALPAFMAAIRALPNGPTASPMTTPLQGRLTPPMRRIAGA
jgi:hypothetical protein